MSQVKYLPWRTPQREFFRDYSKELVAKRKEWDDNIFCEEFVTRSTPLQLAHKGKVD
jgi:hypothetical protein